MIRMKFWHVASTEIRDSITANGLDHRLGESPFPHISYPAGNYLFADRGAAYAEAERRFEEELDEYGMSALPYDVWEVTHTGTVTQDPFHDDESGLGESAVYVTAPIPAANVVLLDTIGG